ncbi:hypothetical protein [Acetobacter sp. KSO5]|uniref:hypothetical protein n=1 Tax=Acetobacter sp. KSO5 TaxID=3373674 RepID=UPI00376EA8B0
MDFQVLEVFTSEVKSISAACGLGIATVFSYHRLMSAQFRLSRSKREKIYGFLKKNPDIEKANPLVLYYAVYEAMGSAFSTYEITAAYLRSNPIAMLNDIKSVRSIVQWNVGQGEFIAIGNRDRQWFEKGTNSILGGIGLAYLIIMPIAVIYQHEYPHFSFALVLTYLLLAVLCVPLAVKWATAARLLNIDKYYPKIDKQKLF